MDQGTNISENRTSFLNTNQTRMIPITCKMFHFQIPNMLEHVPNSFINQDQIPQA